MKFKYTKGVRIGQIILEFETVVGERYTIEEYDLRKFMLGHPSRTYQRMSKSTYKIVAVTPTDPYYGKYLGTHYSLPLVNLDSYSYSTKVRIVG